MLVVNQVMAQEVRIENVSLKGNTYIVDCIADKSDDAVRYHLELQFLVGKNPQLVVPEPKKISAKRRWLKPGENTSISWKFGAENIDPNTIQPILIYTTEVFEGSTLKPSHKWLPAKGHQLLDNGGSSHVVLTYGAFVLAGGAAITQVLSRSPYNNYTRLMNELEDDYSNINEPLNAAQLDDAYPKYHEARKHFNKAKTLQYTAISAAGLALAFWTIDRISLNKAYKKIQQPLIDFDETVSFEPILYFYQNRAADEMGIELGIRCRF